MNLLPSIVLGSIRVERWNLAARRRRRRTGRRRRERGSREMGGSGLVVVVEEKGVRRFDLGSGGAHRVRKGGSCCCWVGMGGMGWVGERERVEGSKARRRIQAGGDSKID